MGERCRRHGRILTIFFEERSLIVQGIGRRRRRDHRFDDVFTESEQCVVAAGVPPMFTLRPALRRLSRSRLGGVDVSQEIAAADHANDMVRTLLNEPGWPTSEEVGWTGAFAAAALVGHADDDAELRRAAIERMRDGLDGGAVDRRRFAHLVDRARSMEGKPQLYGTLFVPVDGVSKAVWPMEPDEEITRARQALGLPPFAEDRRCYERGARPGPFLMPYKRRDWIVLGTRLTLSGFRHGRRPK